MHRTRTGLLLFAIVAALVTVLTSVVAFRSLHGAFEREFQARLAQVAGIAASQVSPADLDEVRALGAASGGWFALQAQLDPLRAVTGFTNFAVVDTNGATLYDVERGEAGTNLPSAYDSLAHDSLRAAWSGRATAPRPWREGAAESRAAFVPVRSGSGAVLAVLVAEAQPSWDSELRDLGRRLALISLVSLAAIAVLTGILLRAADRQFALEQRLTRSENLAAMGRLTATLAHEIKNPLAIIRGSAKRLGKLEPEAQRMADSVIEEVDRLTRTVGRYLQFARVDGAPSGTGDFAVALAATLDLVQGEFASRRVSLERTHVVEAAPVALDGESLKQVALNLLLNALEASPEGGVVRASLTCADGHARFVVEDDGPGVPAPVLERVGEPFHTTKAQGSGLGLFLTRRLAEGAGGRLRVANRPERGATVTVELPLRRG
ncbi:MAG: ATP-binding protein [Candidatus Eisenbacteria bacterium]